MKNINVINGPNLNVLEKRESVYGELSLEKISQNVNENFQGKAQISWFQSNFEGELIEYIQSLNDSSDLLIINPGAFSHTSIAILDALKIYKNPIIEVHISNTYKREDYRGKLLTAQAANYVMKGFGACVYELAIMNGLYILENGVKNVQN